MAIIYEREHIGNKVKEEDGLCIKIRKRIIERLEHAGLRKKTEWAYLAGSFLKEN